MKGALMEEPAELNGVSNLTAMLWTKGTKSRSAEQIAEDVESRGAGLDASSGRNSISVSLQVLAQDLPFALDFLEDLIKNPAFSEIELVKEKEKVKTTILALNDDIVTQTSRAMRQDLFAGHPLSRDEVGTMETVDRITADDIRNFFTRLRDPANMVLAVFGDINRASLEQELTRRFGALSGGNFVPATHDVASVPAPVEKTVRLDKKQAMVMIGFQGSEIRGADRAGLTVLSEILGSSFSGRIFTKVREEFGNAYALGGGYNPAISSGVLYFYALTTDEAVLSVKDKILAILNEIRNNKVPDQELEDMKRYIIGRYQMSLETIGSQAMSSALDELYGLGFSYYKKYPDLIKQVTADDVLRLAQKYLDPQHQVIVLTRPKQIEAGPKQ
jgi:zinc protease